MSFLRFMPRLVGVLCVSVLMGTATAGAVDINTADAETIARELDGVSLPLAQRIVAHRERSGAYRRLDDIINVPYVGEAVIRRNQADILLR